MPCANLIGMATIIIPASLKSHLNGNCQIVVEGNTAREILQRSEKLYPRLKGWILDERSELREHVSLFLNGDRADLTSAVGAQDELHVVQAISGGSHNSEAQSRVNLETTQ